jgi:hypothetical protein
MYCKLSLGVDLMKENQHSEIKKSIFISIPVLFIISAPMHFLFDFTGKLAIIGAFAPVNESPWEHLKLAFFPILAWWIIYYFKVQKSENLSRERWIVSTAAAAISAPLVVFLFFYSYTGAFEVEFLALDIFSLLLAIAVGQWLGFHIYKHTNPSKFILCLSLIAIIIFVFMFAYFTFAPPHIHLFRDKNTGGYGII